MKLRHIAVGTLISAAFAAPAFANDTAKQQSQSDPQAQGSQGQSSQAAQNPDTIRQVQQQLSKNGHDVTVDGKMGPQTQAALKDFQQKQGLQPSGQLDAQTLAAFGMGEDQSSSTGSSRSSAGSSGSSTPDASAPSDSSSK